jgi:hypothetical protein
MGLGRRNRGNLPGVETTRQEKSRKPTEGAKEFRVVHSVRPSYNAVLPVI